VEKMKEEEMEMQVEKVWESTLRYLMRKKNDPILRSFLQEAQLVQRENRFILQVPNQLIRDTLKNRYPGVVEEALTQVLKDSDGSEGVAGDKKEVVLELEIHRAPAGMMEQPWLFPGLKEDSRLYPTLNPNFTFETFVVGKNNHMTHAAALAVSQNPGCVYNPLFIYGGVGLGKTHLLHSIGHYILENAPLLQVQYTPSEEFTHAFITSLQEGKMKEFRRTFRSCDVLLMDDVQFLSRRVETQEALFHIFNVLHDSNRQIVLTSDRSPRELSDIEGRLVSRFTSGLITDIQPPDYETRLAILKKKADSLSTPFPDDVAEFLAGQDVANIRELESILHRVVSYSTLELLPLNLETAQEALKGFFGKKEKPCTFEKILQVVAEDFGLSEEVLLSNKREREVVLARQIIIYIARILTHLSLSDIGRKLGGKDHTTILHAFSKIEALMKEEPSFEHRVLALMDEIKS